MYRPFPQRLPGLWGVRRRQVSLSKHTMLKRAKCKSILLIHGLGNAWKLKGDVCDKPCAKNRDDMLSAFEMKGHLQERLKRCPWTSTCKAGLWKALLCLHGASLRLTSMEVAVTVWSWYLWFQHSEMPLKVDGSGFRGNLLWELECALTREQMCKRPRWKVKI